MRRRSYRLQTENYLNNMARQWWSVHGCESKKCPGPELAANAKDSVRSFIYGVDTSKEPQTNNITIHSTLPHRRKHSQLRQTLAPQLRRSPSRLLLHLRPRRLGQGDPQSLPLRRRLYRNQREAPKAVRCLRDGGRRQED